MLLLEERGLEVPVGRGGIPAIAHVLGEWLLWKAELTLISGLSGMTHSRKSEKTENIILMNIGGGGDDTDFYYDEARYEDDND